MSDMLWDWEIPIAVVLLLWTVCLFVISHQMWQLEKALRNERRAFEDWKRVADIARRQNALWN